MRSAVGTPRPLLSTALWHRAIPALFCHFHNLHFVSYTALILAADAAKYGHPEVARFLLSLGIDDTLKDHCHMTPFAIAQLEGVSFDRAARFSAQRLKAQRDVVAVLQAGREAAQKAEAAARRRKQSWRVAGGMVTTLRARAECALGARALEIGWCAPGISGHGTNCARFAPVAIALATAGSAGCWFPGSWQQQQQQKQKQQQKPRATTPANITAEAWIGAIGLDPVDAAGATIAGSLQWRATVKEGAETARSPATVQAPRFFIGLFSGETVDPGTDGCRSNRAFGWFDTELVASATQSSSNVLASSSAAVGAEIDFTMTQGRLSFVNRSTGAAGSIPVPTESVQQRTSYHVFAEFRANQGTACSVEFSTVPSKRTGMSGSPCSTDEVKKTPMFHLWPKDEACQTIAVEDQFMLDKRWLVCPVVDYNATSRQVYLPKLYGASCHVRSVCI